MGRYRWFSVAYTYSENTDMRVRAVSEEDARAIVQSRWGHLDEFQIQAVEPEEVDDEGSV